MNAVAPDPLKGHSADICMDLATPNEIVNVSTEICIRSPGRQHSDAMISDRALHGYLDIVNTLLRILQLPSPLPGLLRPGLSGRWEADLEALRESLRPDEPLRTEEVMEEHDCCDDPHGDVGKDEVSILGFFCVLEEASTCASKCEAP